MAVSSILHPVAVLQSGKVQARLAVIPLGDQTQQNSTAVQGCGINTIDLKLTLCDQAPPEPHPALPILNLSDASVPCLKFLRQALQLSSGSSGSKVSSVIVKLVFSRDDGYVMRCDFLERRLEGCPYSQIVKSFLEPLSQVKAASIGSTISYDEILRLLPLAIGGIQSLDSESNHQRELLDGLNKELAKRINFPFLSKGPIPRRRLVWVQGRENFESIHRAYEAAWALGITLVFLDEPGHWLEDDNGPHAYLREGFIPISIAVDPDFPQRIVDAVRSYPHPVDGVVTISDVRLPSIAKASELLGLPTEPHASYKLAGDKGTTRLMETQKAGDFTAVVTSVEDLDRILEESVEKIQFPLIVKPCLGWNSDCVAKVKSVDELREAVRRACARHEFSPSKTTRAVIEPYISGPEVDANFIFLDGEILFYQVSDDFPSTGDTIDAARTPEAAASPNFMETIMMLPSGLPEDEQLILRESLKESIFRQGFRSGVIHCEARVRDSRTTYVSRPDNGLVDLHIPDGQPQKEASCYLHEINARTPGYFSSVSVMLAHGVDYYAVRMLFALGDETKERIRALSMPFAGDTQYTLGIAVFPATRSGIMETEDSILEMLEKYPWMREWIADYQTMRKGGSQVFGPGETELWYLGYASVISRSSRKECLERIQRVKESFSYKLVGE